MSIFSTDQTFEQVLRPHLSPLYRFAYTLCGNRDDAEDLVQDVVVKMYPKRQDLLKLEKPATWLSKVLYHQFLDNHRRKQRSPVSLLADQQNDEHQVIDFENFASQQADPSGELEQHGIMNDFQQALNQLSEDFRIAIMMFEIEGYSLAEMEEILDVPQGTLKSRLHRARNQLKNILIQGTKTEDRACTYIGDI